MSIILMKEEIQTTRLISQKYSQTTIDNDVIVPDICPDIKKILEVSGYISVNEKSLLGGKVYIQGIAYMTVLYAPDGETHNKVKSLNTSQPFSQSIDTGYQNDNIIFNADIEAENFNYSLINSRKINLRCTIGTNIKLSESKCFEIASPEDISDEICTQTQKLRLCDTPVFSENRVVISNQFEVEAGSPSIGEILKVSVVPEALELIATENSAHAKGQLKVCFLYTSYDDGSVHSSEYLLPFEENFDVPGLEEDMEAEIDYMLSDLHYEIRDDSDGEPRLFWAEIGLSAHLRGIKILEPEIICDAYTLSGTSKCLSDSIKLEQLISNTTAQLTHKASIKLPEHLPEIAKICDISISASVDRISVDKTETTVSGHIKINVLYTTTDENYPLCAFSDISDFSHTLPSAASDESLICEAKIFTEHTSYTMNNSDSIDIRAVLGLSVRSFTETTICPVIDIEQEDIQEWEKKPGICIFFVQKGDTLWNIAKKYKTTVEKLKENNNLTSDNLSIGQQIKIC